MLLIEATYVCKNFLALIIDTFYEGVFDKSKGKEVRSHEKHDNSIFTLKFGYSEKATKFEKIYHLKFDVTEQRQRSTFQTFWKPDCCPDFLFFKLETSNFSYLLIF